MWRVVWLWRWCSWWQIWCAGASVWRPPGWCRLCWASAFRSSRLLLTPKVRTAPLPGVALEPAGQPARAGRPGRGCRQHAAPGLLLALTPPPRPPPAPDPTEAARAKKRRKKGGKHKGGKGGDEVDAAFQEAVAHADREAQRTNQSTALEALFEIFFRCGCGCCGVSLGRGAVWGGRRWPMLNLGDPARRPGRSAGGRLLEILFFRGGGRAPMGLGLGGVFRMATWRSMLSVACSRVSSSGATLVVCARCSSALHPLSMRQMDTPLLPPVLSPTPPGAPWPLLYWVLKACTASGLLSQPDAPLLTVSRCEAKFPLLLPALEGLRWVSGVGKGRQCGV